MSLSLGQIPVVILAGGFGTRIQHLLSNLPKPMAPVLGRPFIEWVVRYLAVQGTHNVVVSTGYLGETIKNHFTRSLIPGVTVQCVPESTPLGTAGGFINAMERSGTAAEAWLVMNGDSLALAPLHPLVHLLDRQEVMGAIMGVAMNDASRYGTVVHDDTGRLLRFEEKRPGGGTINAGIYLLRTELVKSLPDRRPLSFEKDAFPAWVKADTNLKVATAVTPFLDIGTPESLPLAESFIQGNRSAFLE